MQEEKSLETMTETMRNRSAPLALVAPGFAKRNVAPRLWRPAVSLAIVAVGAVILLSPARKAEARALTWGQIAASTFAAGPRHGVTRHFEGWRQAEFWTDGVRDARVAWFAPRKDRSGGRAILEHRSDGRRSFFLSAWDEDGPRPEQPNALRVGVRFRVTGDEDWRRTGWHDFPGGTDLVDNLIARRDVTILSQRALGSRREVRIRLVDPSLSAEPQTGTIIADERGRIVEARGLGLHRDGTTVYDYPASIPDRVFEPRPQVWPSQILEDAPIRARIRSGVARGLGHSSGVTLRAVVIDRSGKLYVLYSGALPPGALPRSVVIAGVRSSRPFGLKPWVQGAPGPAIVNGVRLGGMGLTPLSRLQDRLTLRVPTSRGWATFRNVAPERIVSIYSYSHELGLTRRHATAP